MARKIRIKARTSFNGVREGDSTELELTPTVQGWINAGLAEEVKAAAQKVVAEARALKPLVEPGWVTATRKGSSDGPSKARPSSAEPDADERKPSGTDGSKPSGGGAGKGFGAGSYGAPAGVDQG